MSATRATPRPCAAATAALMLLDVCDSTDHALETTLAAAMSAPLADAQFWVDVWCFVADYGRLRDACQPSGRLV